MGSFSFLSLIGPSCFIDLLLLCELTFFLSWLLKGIYKLAWELILVLLVGLSLKRYNTNIFAPSLPFYSFSEACLLFISFGISKKFAKFKVLISSSEVFVFLLIFEDGGTFNDFIGVEVCSRFIGSKCSKKVSASSYKFLSWLYSVTLFFLNNSDWLTNESAKHKTSLLYNKISTRLMFCSAFDKYWKMIFFNKLLL